MTDVENNIQNVDLLNGTTSKGILNELPSNVKKSCCSPQRKIFTIGLLLMSVLIFSSSLILLTGTTSIFLKESNISSSEIQSDLLIGLPGQGFLLGSTERTAWTNKTVIQFLGIPFAESPSGVRRFKPPIPKTPWKGIYDASQYGRSCPDISKWTQMDKNLDDLEDCLILNVFTKDRKSKFPVMVYIHGGGFTAGSANEFPPNFLLEKDIVLVVIQYRLGVLGFISTQTEEIPGNAAVHDVILALKWVQKYIQYFGGDPNKVTIFGQSAGSAIVTLLTLTPAIPNYKLFHQAIAQSGSIFSQWAINEKPVLTAKFVCENICKKENNFCSTVENINNCLTQTEVKNLVKLSPSGLSLTLGDYWGIIPTLPQNLINRNKFKYTTLTGVTKHDGSFVLSSIYDKIEKYSDVENMNTNLIFRTIIENVNADKSGIVYNLLYREILSKKSKTNNSFIDLIPEFVDLCSILYFKSPALTYAKKISEKNVNKTFLYTFNYQGEHSRFGYGKSIQHYPFNGGVHHSDDYMYLFPYHFKNFDKDDTAFAKKFVELWTSFASKGVPSINETHQLAPIKDSGPYLKIDKDLTIGVDFSDEFFAAINDPENYKLKIKKTN